MGAGKGALHAELEGKALLDTFVELLTRFAEQKVRFVTLAEAAAEFGAGAPCCELRMGSIEGRAMQVAIQG